MGKVTWLECSGYGKSDQCSDHRWSAMGFTLEAGRRAAAQEGASRGGLQAWWPSGQAMGSRGLAMQESPQTAWVQGMT